MTERRPIYDAAVLGAGPAGCAAAIVLSRRGMRVALLERKEFPRVKVCGECVSPASSGVLESLLSPGELRSAGARVLNLYAIEMGDRAVEWSTPRPAWALSRASLDGALAARARESGVEVLQPAGVRAVDYDDEGVRVHVSGRDEPLDARVVIHADGSGRFDRAGPTPMRAGVLGVKCHYTPPAGEPVVGVRMRACEGAYLGTVAVERGLATCAMTVRDRVVSRFVNDPAYGSRDAALDAMTRTLWPEFADRRRVGPWHVCGVAGSGYTEPGHARSFRVGNAAAAVEPVGGEGIGLALWSGATLGESLDPRDAASLARTRREFGRRYRARLRVRRPACLLAASALMRPSLLRAAWPLLEAPGSSDALIRAFWTLSGKPA